jgi:hypothetical protein
MVIKGHFQPRSHKAHRNHKRDAAIYEEHAVNKKNTRLERGRYFGQKWYPHGNQGEKQ